MGVHGLWKLLEPSGKAVPLETLENKVLAVDVSIWLHQLVAGYQDSGGNAVPNAHLLGLFHRICKLLFYKIKPVFVFDGNVPLLKKQTVAERQRQKSKLREDANEVRVKLAKNILKYAAVKEALGSESAGSRVKLSGTKPSQEADIFELPPLQSINAEECESDGSELDRNLISPDSSDEDSLVGESCVHADVHSIDVNGQDFKSLPADIRHDILTELKDTRKQSSWGLIHEMPEDSSQFSNFQMKRLLKRRNFQVSLEEAEKEMGGHTLSLAELEDLLNDQGVLVNKNVDLGRRIASDSVTRFVYIRDEAKKTLFNSATNSDVELKSKTSSSKALNTPSVMEQNIKSAITTKVVIPVEDDEFEQDWSSDSEPSNNKSNEAMNTNCKSRVDLARDFMFVASALTPDQINKIVQRNASPRKHLKAVSDGSSSFNSPRSRDVAAAQEDTIIFGPSTSSARNRMPEQSTFNDISHTVEEDLDYIGIISDDESGSSDDQLQDDGNEKKTSNYPLEVTVQLDRQYNIEEDMFADIFFNIEHDLKQAQRKVSQPMLMHEESKVIEEKMKDIHSVEEVDEAQVDDKESKTTSCTGIVNSISSVIIPEKNVSVEPSLVYEFVESVKSSYDSSPPCADSISSNETVKQSDVLKQQSINIRIDTQLDPESTCDKLPSDDIVSAETSDVEIISSESISDNSVNSPSKSIIIEESSRIHSEVKQVPHVKDSQSGINMVPVNREYVPEEREVEQVSQVNNTSSIQGSSAADSEVTASPTRQSPLPAAPKFSAEDLLGMQASLVDRHMDLLMEKGKSDRMAASITQQMCSQAQDLLRLFGLPYLVAPMEAEAQCAFLDLISLTDGTISDDSDIWLFGGRKVYKNFFNQKKHVMQFTDGDIHGRLRLARNQMILLALLTGSDYTSGLSGVGPVTALEILAAFPCGNPGSDPAAIDNLAVGLKHFRDWLKNGRPAGPGTTKLRNKLKDLQLNDGFPSLAVIEAYLQPTVDESHEKFTWGKPDVPKLRDYAREKFGWTRLKTDEILTPVLNKLNERNSQGSLDSYFQVSVKLPPGDSKLSKRVQKAVNRLRAESTFSDTEDDPLPLKKRKVRKLRQNNQNNEDVPPNDESRCKVIKPKKSVTGKSHVATNEPSVGCSSTGEFIPQRAQDKLNALQSKLKAIELFRNSKGPTIKTKPIKRPKRIEKAEAELSESSSD